MLAFKLHVPTLASQVRNVTIARRYICTTPQVHDVTARRTKCAINGVSQCTLPPVDAPCRQSMHLVVIQCTLSSFNAPCRHLMHLVIIQCTLSSVDAPCRQYVDLTQIKKFKSPHRAASLQFSGVTTVRALVEQNIAQTEVLTAVIRGLYTVL